MAKFLKFIVNTVMIVAIVVAASLLVPPLAGVTTLIVDDIEMDTNLETGSVTYAWGVAVEELKVGDKVLLQEDADMVYLISAIESAEDGTNFVLEDKVQLRHLSKDGKKITRPAGEGVCKLDRNGFSYIGTDDGESVAKIIPIKNIYRILFGAGENFEIYDGKELYYFVPENKRSCVMWYIVSEILQQI